MNKHEVKISQYATSVNRIEPLLDKAIYALSAIEKLCKHVNVKRKRKIIGSIFREKPTFTGVGYQAGKIDEISGVILFIKKLLCVKSGKNKSGKFQLVLSGYRMRTGANQK